MPKEYFSPDTLLRNISPAFSQSHRRKNGKGWKLIVYYVRGFCINTKLCKMWGFNERHFLLRAPTSFEKNYISREAKNRQESSDNALVWNHSTKKGPGSSWQLTAVFLPLGKAKEKVMNFSWAPPRPFPIPKSSPYPCKVGVISPIL